MGHRVVLGTFDAEKHWRDNKYAILPQITDISITNIVNTMDELLFILCETGDTLVTNFEINNELINYLTEITLLKDNRFFNLSDISCTPKNENFSIFECLINDKRNHINTIFTGCDEIAPYAVLPGINAVCELADIKCKFPAIEIIKKVNSKAYSNEVNDMLEFWSYGKIIKNSNQLFEYGINEFEKGFLIKDIFGVSGKGNILINSEKTLNRIVKYISLQECKGLEVLFVVEKLLDKIIDFSCQVYIDENGNIEILSIQKIINKGFSYIGSVTAESNFYDFLCKEKYFDKVTRIANKLYQDGYFGNLCIDSMVLKSNEIIPIIELNARGSMGLINSCLDKKLSVFDVSEVFSFLNVGFNNSFCFSDILEKLHNDGLLFNNNRCNGIIPLSSNSIFINRENEKVSSEVSNNKGRFYYSAVSKDRSELANLQARLSKSFNELDFNVYN